MNLFTTLRFYIRYLSNATQDGLCPVNVVMFDCYNVQFLCVNNICNMDIQLNQTSFGIFDLIKISERLGGKDLVTLFGRSTRFSGIVTREPIAKPATTWCAGY